nr:nucleotidyltransferase domain-containing protein [Agrococcus sp. ARC_14]
MASDLCRIDGVEGVMLGGSRARGAAAPGSDADLGIYLRGAVDEEAIAALAEGWSDASAPPARWTQSGAWGPWVDGGAWLVVDGTAVDWIRRDLERVEAQWERARRGEFAFHAQPGHPHGFLDAGYCAELALGRMLADPSGALNERRERMQEMPAALGSALADRIWEASFSVDAAAKAAARGDAAYVALCLAHAALISAHAIHGRDLRWSTNEKGLVAAAARLPSAPTGFAASVTDALALGDASGTALSDAVERARRLVDRVEAALAVPEGGSEARRAPSR